MKLGRLNKEKGGKPFACPEIFRTFMFSTSNSEYGSEWKFAGTSNIKKTSILPITEVLRDIPVVGCSKIRRKRKQYGHACCDLNHTAGNPLCNESSIARAQPHANAFSGNPTTHPLGYIVSVDHPDRVANPLYRRSSSDIGGTSLQTHHIPDTYFPKTNQFTSSFTDMSRDSHGFVTSIHKSNVP